jgi:8-oxo-dGTP diphosphatase
LSESLRVAVGLLIDGQGRLLVNQRRPDTYRAGAWEFPGGKLRDGETAAQALERELDEELGIVVEGAEPFMFIEHAYEDRQVALEIFRVLAFRGEPRSREGQVLRWVALTELEKIGLLEADRPIVAKLRGELRQPSAGQDASTDTA